MNEYDLLLGLDLGDEEKMRLMADSLRGKQRAADFFSLSTIPQISESAQASRERTSQQAERTGLLRQALANRELQASEGALNREAQVLTAALRANGRGGAGGTVKYAKPWVNEDGKVRMIGFIGTQPYDLHSQQPLSEEELSGWAPQDPMSETSFGNAMSVYEGKMSDAESLVSAVEALDDVLSEYQDRSVSDIPALGFFEKFPVIGGPTRFIQDALKPGAEQGIMASRIAGVINVINRLAAGLTQTRTELSRIEKATGQDPWSDPQVFVSNYDTIKTALEADLRRIRNTTNKRVLGEIDKRYSTEGLPNPTTHTFRRLKFGAERPGLSGVLGAEESDLPNWQDYIPAEGEMSDEQLLQLQQELQQRIKEMSE